MPAVSLADTLPATLVATGAQVTLAVDAGAPSPCAAPVTCTVGAQSVSATGISIAGGHTETLRYTAIGLGLDRACSDASNSAVASVPIGSSATAVAPVTICQTGLGYENSWSYVTKPVGPHTQASVNVANG